MEPAQGEVNARIAAKAREFCEALRNWAYTRKDEDKKRVVAIQVELIQAVKKETEQ